MPRSPNRLLASLPSADYERIAPMLQPVPLAAGQTIYRVKAPIDTVYFPLGGMISAMAVMHDGAAVEVAAVGNEGMTGLTAFMGTEVSPYEVMVQVPGEALRMDAAVLKAEADRPGPLRHMLSQYYNAFTFQVSYSVACNGLHRVEQRCCRWLLMAADRVGSNVLTLTHDLIGMVLGVRRASVSHVLRVLEERGLVHIVRREVAIIDRPGLEAAACECYRKVADDYDHLFGAKS